MGIGTGTNSPAAQLDVSGKTKTTDLEVTGTCQGDTVEGKKLNLKLDLADENPVGTIKATEDDPGNLKFLEFSTQNSDTHFSFSNGNVGIGTGTNTPTAQLDVNGNSRETALKVTGTTTLIGKVGVEGIIGNPLQIDFQQGDSLSTLSRIGSLEAHKTIESGVSTTELTLAALNSDLNGSSHLKLEADEISVTGSNINITGNFSFHNHQLTVTEDGVWTSSSREFKENIAAISPQEVFELVRSLNPVKFSYKADPQAKPHFGFIAEDAPNLVASPDKKAISPIDIVAILTKAVQQHQHFIYKLSNLVKEQQQEIDSLKKKVRILEEG